MIIKIAPDKEKAKSILGMCESREYMLGFMKKGGFPTVIAESYYEIIKELITSLLLIDGIKFIGDYAHKDLIQKLFDYDFNVEEIKIISKIMRKFPILSRAFIIPRLLNFFSFLII